VRDLCFARNQFGKLYKFDGFWYRSSNLPRIGAFSEESRLEKIPIKIVLLDVGKIYFECY
jgi:hypothetical protein